MCVGKSQCPLIRLRNLFCMQSLATGPRPNCCNIKQIIVHQGAQVSLASPCGPQRLPRALELCPSSFRSVVNHRRRLQDHHPRGIASNEGCGPRHVTCCGPALFLDHPARKRLQLALRCITDVPSLGQWYWKPFWGGLAATCRGFAAGVRP